MKYGVETLTTIKQGSNRNKCCIEIVDVGLEVISDVMSNRNKCCIEIHQQKQDFKQKKESNRNKCCIEILYKILLHTIHISRTETSVVLKSGQRQSKRIDFESNRNKCCIEIKMLLIKFLIHFKSNRNKCCIEIDLKRQINDEFNNRTETSVVLKCHFIRHISFSFV